MESQCLAFLQSVHSDRTAEQESLLTAALRIIRVFLLFVGLVMCSPLYKKLVL